MHRGLAREAPDSAKDHEHQHQPAPTDSDCRLRGSCDGPMSALLTLLSNHGILPDATDPMPALTGSATGIVGRTNVAGTHEPPDPPPPRS
jgi:hypothetical protein